MGDSDYFLPYYKDNNYIISGTQLIKPNTGLHLIM